MQVAACLSCAASSNNASPKTRPNKRSGFARFTNARFSMSADALGDVYVHLTNVAVQKRAPTFDRARGLKWPLRDLRLFLGASS